MLLFYNFVSTRNSWPPISVVIHSFFSLPIGSRAYTLGFWKLKPFIETDQTSNYFPESFLAWECIACTWCWKRTWRQLVGNHFTSSLSAAAVSNKLREDTLQILTQFYSLCTLVERNVCYTFFFRWQKVSICMYCTVEVGWTQIHPSQINDSFSFWLNLHLILFK